MTLVRIDIAAHILFLGSIEGWFTSRKLADYFAGRKDDPVHARRIINSLDCAVMIAGYYHHFVAALMHALIFRDCVFQSMASRKVRIGEVARGRRSDPPPTPKA